MTGSASGRNTLWGVVNCLLMLAWVGVTLYLILPHRGFFLVLIAGAPLACFYAWRITTTRLIVSLLVASGFGYLKEYLASAADVWLYPTAIPGLHVAFIMGFAGIAAFSVAEAVDAVFGLRRNLSGTSLYANSGIIFVVFATLIILLTVESDGAAAQKVAAAPPVIIFYVVIGLLAWYFASIARTGRLLSLLIGGALICAVGDQLGADADLWRFYGLGKCPWFLILASWPLEVFVWYSLGAVFSELLSSPSQRRRDHLQVLVRGSIDRPAMWTAEWQSYLMTLTLALAIGAMAYEHAVFADDQYLFSIVVAVLYTIVLLVAERAYCLRVVWLFGLGVVLGYAFYFCRILSFDTGTATHLFMLPVWAMLAVATYGTGAALARNEWTGEEWTALDSPGWLSALITIVAIVLLVLAGTYFGLMPDISNIPVVAAVVLWAAIAVTAAALAGLAPAIPLVLAGIGFLYARDQLVQERQVLAVLLFGAVTAHLAYKTIVELRTRTLVSFTVSAVLLSVFVIALGMWSEVMVAPRFPWFVALGLMPLLLLACCTVSGSGSGTKQNRIPRASPQLRSDQLYALPSIAPPDPNGKSLVALATARDSDGSSRAERVTACLNRALRLLDDHSPGSFATRPISRFVKDGDTVFIKPNVVLPLYSPCVILPDLIDELAELCAGRIESDQLEAEEERYAPGRGAVKVRIGETSLSEFTSRQTLESTGFKEFWEDEVPDERVEVELLDESEWKHVVSPPESSEETPAPEDEGPSSACEGDEPFNWLPKSLCDCDTYINVSKLKTHYITGVTLSIKNSLGLVLDDDKWIEHCGCYENVDRLARKLVRIMRARKPNLVLIDGFDGLEGDGPFVGKRVDTEYIIASADPVAADCVGAALMGRCVKDIDTCRIGAQLGLGRNDWTKIEVVVEEGPDDAPVDRLITDLPGGLAPFVHEFLRPEPAPTDDVAHIGPITLISQDPLEERAGPWSTLYGVLSLIRPMAEVYLEREMGKLSGLTIVYGGLKDPIEAEMALLFGERAIASRDLVYAPVIWQVPGEIPNRYLAAMDQVAWGGDVPTLKLITTSLRKTKGDYL